MEWILMGSLQPFMIPSVLIFYLIYGYKYSHKLKTMEKKQYHGHPPSHALWLVYWYISPHSIEIAHRNLDSVDMKNLSIQYIAGTHTCESISFQWWFWWFTVLGYKNSRVPTRTSTSKASMERISSGMVCVALFANTRHIVCDTRPCSCVHTYTKTFWNLLAGHRHRRKYVTDRTSL